MIKALDMFSGCGGVSCGLKRVGFTVRVAVEIEKSAQLVYNAYKPLKDVKVIQEDICGVSGERILREAEIERDELYLFAGCPPCQNFSRQNPNNKNKTVEERKKLLFRFLEIIEEIRPPFILMENVPGIKTEFKKNIDKSDFVSNKEILDEFLIRLRNEESADDGEKYFVIENILNAANYGVPQLRRRFVLHAVRYDIYHRLQHLGIDFILPKQTYDAKGKNGLKKWVTVKDSIGDLPPIQAGESYSGTQEIYNHKSAGLNKMNIERMELIRKNGGSRTGLPADMVLDCHKKKDKNGVVFGGHKDVYGIMSPDKPSPTITGGCLFYSKGRYGHYEQNRAISIREAARLQTFPDDFIFSNVLGEAALQIGNAVPVKLVEASGHEFIKCIRALLNAEQ